MTLVFEIAAGVVLGLLAFAYLPQLLNAATAVIVWAVLLAGIGGLAFLAPRYPIILEIAGAAMLAYIALGIARFSRGFWQGLTGAPEKESQRR